MGADLGEPIDIQKGKGGMVSVSGVVSSAERKHELFAALKGLPQVVIGIQTEEEATPKEVSARVTHAEPLIATVRSPIEKELLAYFGGGPLAVETFSRRTITVLRDLMAHAWAVRHLADRYRAGSEDEVALSDASRGLLKTMRRDHYRVMSDATSELTALLGPVLRSIVRSGSEVTKNLPLFDSAKEVQRLTLELVSGSASTGSNEDNDRAKVARNLLVALRELENTIQEQP